MKTLSKFAALLALCVTAVFGQATTAQTTLSAAVSAYSTAQWCLASGSAVVLPSTSTVGSILFTDREAAQVVTAGSSSSCFIVKRGQQGTSANYSHASGSVVWVGAPSVGTGDNSRPFTGAFIASAPSGSCTASLQATLPVIVTGSLGQGTAGGVFTCLSSRWVALQDGAFYVPPSQCSFAPTTLTVTVTYPQIGASNIVVANGVTNAAAGTLTMVCNVYVPNNVAALRGAILTDITAFVGSQVVAPTSLGTATLGTWTFPAAAASETASTVTPVTAGSVTTVSPSQITTVTTAGSFLTIKVTPATPIDLSADLKIVQFTLPLVQSAASAMTVNTAGLFVHYSIPTSSLNPL